MTGQHFDPETFEHIGDENLMTFVSGGSCEWCGAVVVGAEDLHMDWHLELNRRLGATGVAP